MNKKERVTAAIEGRVPDYVPCGFSLHFPKERAMGEEAVAAHLEFFEKTDTDIFKIMKYTPAEVEQMVQHALDEAGGSRFILSPTCVLLASTPCENLKAVSDYLKSKESA